ncbi:MAG: ABC transporter substrate-binding protein [Desulfobulbaceae bacterium]|nr:ABC transporter substrate-binding protein [Desulfobulbaceae bacterium]
MKYWKATLLISVLLIFPALIGCERGREENKSEALEKPYKVAILLVSDMYVPLSAQGLKQGMRELGYREGENIHYYIYNAHGDVAELKFLAREIVDSRPDVICPSIIPAINAVRETGTELPVVFLESMYPVEFGLAKSLTMPSANYTGVSNMTGPMSGKRLELLFKMVPGIKRVALICNPDNSVSRLSMETTKEAAAKLGLQLDIHLIYKYEEVDNAIGMVEASPVDALVLNPDFMVFSRLKEIIAMAEKKKIPTMGIDQTQVEQGILAGYGGGLKEIAHQAARHVNRILKGESPAAIPVEPPRMYKLFINMTTAEAIGVTLSDEILHQAAGYYR